MGGNEPSAHHLTELIEMLPCTPWPSRSPPVTISKTKGHQSGLLLQQGNMNKDLRGISFFITLQRGNQNFTKGVGVGKRQTLQSDKPTVRVAVASVGLGMKGAGGHFP